jgi:TPR repeat protein
MRKLSIALLALSCAVTVVLAQGPPLNATPEQLFEAGMNAFTGEANTRDNAVAREYFRRSADQGYAPAQVVLGFLYDTATTVPASPHDAASWYRKAADGGDSLAQWLLGRLYLNGALPQDDFAAEKWLTPAASQDNPFAAYLLGRLMLTRGYTKAPRRLRVAAEQGLPQAQYLYAKALAEGRGVAQDRFQAYVWFLVALDAGYPASSDLSYLNPFLSPDQIDQAKAKARDLEDSVTRSVAAHRCTGWNGEFGDIPTPPPPQKQRFCR